MTVSINGTGGITFADASTQSTGGYTGFRNRIINGDMRIDQRNAGASIVGGNNFGVDRFQTIVSQSSKYNVQQNAGSVTPPSGFTNYLGITSTSAYSVISSDYFAIRQFIEGFNIADLGWGTASASPVTLSFWVRSSLTGTFGGALQNASQTRAYPYSYTISVANTWEYKTITIAGETTGTWLTNNGQGIGLYFSLGTGSSSLGTAGAWAASSALAPTGATSIVGTSGATFYITGVQLEKGSVATPFEFRQYGQELALCQRYYQNVNYGGAWYVAGTGVLVDMEDRALGGPQFFTVMRATPTFSITADGGGSQSIRSFGGDSLRTVTGVSVTTSGMSSCTHSGTYTLGRSYAATWKAEAEL